MEEDERIDEIPEDLEEYITPDKEMEEIEGEEGEEDFDLIDPNCPYECPPDIAFDCPTDQYGCEPVGCYTPDGCPTDACDTCGLAALPCPTQCTGNHCWAYCWNETKLYSPYILGSYISTVCSSNADASFLKNNTVQPNKLMDFLDAQRFASGMTAGTLTVYDGENSSRLKFGARLKYNFNKSGTSNVPCNCEIH